MKTLGYGDLEWDLQSPRESPAGHKIERTEIDRAGNAKSYPSLARETHCSEVATPVLFLEGCCGQNAKTLSLYFFYIFVCVNKPPHCSGALSALSLRATPYSAAGGEVSGEAALAPSCCWSLEAGILQELGEPMEHISYLFRDRSKHSEPRMQRSLQVHFFALFPFFHEYYALLTCFAISTDCHCLTKAVFRSYFISTFSFLSSKL